jgi:hypothetical protein
MYVDRRRGFEVSVLSVGFGSAVGARGLVDRNHGHFDTKVRLCEFDVDISLSLLLFSASVVCLGGFGGALLVVPTLVPVISRVAYPKIESPSTLLWRVKFGIDFDGLGTRKAVP